MLLGLEGRESHVMPYLVLRLIRWSGGLVADSDCITWPFWVPGWNKLCSLLWGVDRSYEAWNGMPDMRQGRSRDPVLRTRVLVAIRSL